MGFEVLESQALTGSSSESVARMGQGGEAAGDRVGGQNGFPSVRMWYSVDLGHRGPPETYDLLPRACDKLPRAAGRKNADGSGWAFFRPLIPG